jgi:hypothetical protein
VGSGPVPESKEEGQCGGGGGGVGPGPGQEGEESRREA